MSPAKRQKLSQDSDHAVSISEDDSIHSQQGGDLEEESEPEDFGSADEASSPDTEDEIADTKRAKSKKTLKRKRRATEPSQFAATLQSLLDTDTPSALPLSLKPSVARQKNDAKLELKAKKVLQIEKKDKEDKGRIRDVIGGWGGESERSLRKVAQRGVVKLFNTIQQSQAAAAVAAEETKASRGSGKPSLPAPSLDKKSSAKNKGKHRDNLVGRGKEAAVDKDDFFNMIRSGGIVSKV
ncbi:hypothetical protein BV22DRAFT_1103006 [Leucogyrophana mollusca]|uniref:Uncharacterized protein n=1 Tax=Leucogyrophana mollusca TaxID=85980 RepID=A0ACB8BU19_9AGAM|nr:hypothetical protein BV22DRAFT_1103006 [Leucogyrophana mollusca]